MGRRDVQLDRSILKCVARWNHVLLDFLKSRIGLKILVKAKIKLCFFSLHLVAPGNVIDQLSVTWMDLNASSSSPSSVRPSALINSSHHIVSLGSADVREWNIVFRASRRASSINDGRDEKLLNFLPQLSGLILFIRRGHKRGRPLFVLAGKAERCAVEKSIFGDTADSI